MNIIFTMKWSGLLTEFLWRKHDELPPGYEEVECRFCGHRYRFHDGQNCFICLNRENNNVSKRNSLYPLHGFKIGGDKMIVPVDDETFYAFAERDKRDGK